MTKVVTRTPLGWARDAGLSMAVLAMVTACAGENSGGDTPAGTACPAGRTACSGVCVDLESSGSHCGACGEACGTGESCVGGVCECGPAQQRCGDACVDISSDPGHCGSCEVTCSGTSVCSNGQCQTECDPGLSACDRSCVDTRADEAHCGACGMACAPDQTCNGGVCECPSGQQVCAGTCIDTRADPLNCGQCGTVCGAAQQCVAGACAGGGTGTGGATGGTGATGGSPSGGTGATGGSPSGGTGATGGEATGGDPSGGGPPVATTCDPSVSLRDTAGAQVVGDGSPTSCTEAALRSAIEAAAVVTFDCGPEPVTIAMTEEIVLPTDRDTVVDGGGTVTLDGGNATRHFRFESGNWMVTTTTVTLQRLILRNGRAPAGEYFPPVEGYPECAYGYKEGSGGAVYVRDGVLHVIDCEFYDNQAALVGPDVGGGALYVQGSAGVVISGSRFVGNRGANGGAVGMLFANPEIYNSVFEDNTAEGTGQNRAVSEEECPAIYEFGHANQAGAGGLAGGVYFDGASDEDHVYVICGSVFRNNRANELAGALFRTPNVGMRQMRIESSVFDANTATGGGVSFIQQNDVTVIGSLFMNNRSGLLIDGTDVGGWASGLWINEGTIDLLNSSFYDNALDVDGGGALTNGTFSESALNGSFTVQNCLFVNTSCDSIQPGARNVQWPEASACAEGTTFADPALGTPADHGGPTPTLMPGNAAAVAGVGADCPPTDQRGEPRTTTSCAAGAVEP